MPYILESDTEAVERQLNSPTLEVSNKDWNRIMNHCIDKEEPMYLTIKSTHDDATLIRAWFRNYTQEFDPPANAERPCGLL